MTGESSNGRADWVLGALDRFEGPLIQYAHRLLGDRGRAHDVVQDTFLKLCKQDRDEVEGHLARWLYTVCRNRAIDVRRKESRMTTTDEVKLNGRPAAEPGPAHVAETRDAAEHAARVLADLPESQQEVLELKLRHGLPYREIARITGRSVGNVGFLIHTGLRTLRARMGVKTHQPRTAGGAR